MPFFGAVLLVARFVVNTRPFWVATGLALAIVGAASSGPPLKSDSRFDQRMAKSSGIVDERAFYIKTNSLLSASRASFAQPEWELQRTDLDREWNVLDTCGRESLKTSRNEIADAPLRSYYAKLRLIVRGRKLFSKARLEAIAQMNLGAFDTLIDFDRYRYGGTIRSLADLTQVKADQTPWDAPGVVKVWTRWRS